MAEYRWCAQSRYGWCAVVPNREPEEGSWSVETACGQGVTLPWGYDCRPTNCPDCIAVLGGHVVVTDPAEQPEK